MRVSCPLPADWSVRAELRPKALAKSLFVRKSPRLPSTGTGRHVAAARGKVESTQRGSHPQFSAERKTIQPRARALIFFCPPTSLSLRGSPSQGGAQGVGVLITSKNLFSFLPRVVFRSRSLNSWTGLDYLSSSRALTSQVKSGVTPRGNKKAARSVNHRGLPGGGGLWVCMRRPQQLYGPRGMSVRARALRC
jgi:hypothetical protein